MKKAATYFIWSKEFEHSAALSNKKLYSNSSFSLCRPDKGSLKLHGIGI